MLQRLQVSSIGTFCNDKHLCLNFEDLRIITCLSLIARHFPLSITCRKCRFPLTWNPPSAKIFNTSCYMTFYFPQFWFQKGTSFYLHPSDIDGEDGTSKLKQGFPRWISDTHNTLPSVEMCVHSDLLICTKVIMYMYIFCFCMSSPVSLLLYSLQEKPGVPGTATFLKHREESLKSLKLFVFGCLRYLWTEQWTIRLFVESWDLCFIRL